MGYHYYRFSAKVISIKIPCNRKSANRRNWHVNRRNSPLKRQRYLTVKPFFKRNGLILTHDYFIVRTAFKMNFQF